jgi:hypothetical protein
MDEIPKDGEEPDIGTHRFETDCSNLPQGLYLINMKSRKDIITKKLIVQ